MPNIYYAFLSYKTIDPSTPPVTIIFFSYRTAKQDIPGFVSEWSIWDSLGVKFATTSVGKNWFK